MEGCAYLYTEKASTEKLQSKMNTLVFFFMVYYTNNYYPAGFLHITMHNAHCVTESLWCSVQFYKCACGVAT